MSRDPDLRWLRCQFITALAEDDELFDLLILKGGNAISLVHKIGLRASLDIDYSMEADVENPEVAIGERAFRALRSRLEPQGFVVFDEKFTPRPKVPGEQADKRWGGYNLEFKLASKELWDELQGNIERLRMQSITVSGERQAQRKFRIEISKYEYCQDREEREVDDFVTCQVYTPSLLVAEKLRSICQQMREYEHRVHPVPRSRDFYDLHALLTEGGVELSESGVDDVIRSVFEAKRAPLRLLACVPSYREFHEDDWDSVVNTIPAGRSRDYGFYFEFVVAELRKLQHLWVEDPP